MASTTQDVPTTAATQIREENPAAILHLLDAEDMSSWSDIATLVLRDPSLMHAILRTLAAERSDDSELLRAGLSDRVEAFLRNAGGDLLRTWLLFGQGTHSREASLGLAKQPTPSSLLAEYARHLAIAMRYPYPDEAYLAGLFHPTGSSSPAQIGKLLQAATASEPDSTSRSQLLSPALIDALTIGDISDEQCLSAHPLFRIIQSACLLIRHDWDAAASRVVNLTGLTTDILASLRADVGRLAGTAPATTPAVQGTTVLEHPATAATLLTGALGDAALSGLLRLIFERLSDQTLARRYKLACHLLGDIPPPVLLVIEADDHIRAVPLGIASATETFVDELNLRLEDESSVISLAARSARASSWTTDPLARARSLIDMQIGRRLGPHGFDCIPLRSASGRGLALRNRVSGLRPAGGDSLMNALCAAAFDAWARERQRRIATDELAQSIEQRFREHARRLAHEANNPLTIIRSYLEVMSAQRQDPELQAEVAIINTEIDRLTGLIRELATPATPGLAEPGHCALESLFNDLRTLYAATLFDQRGIQFEVRVAPGLPDVAMPASRLKQILINLFRNASEALLPGGRFSVVVPGQLISNGVPCVEIRLIDNGPGLPRERIADLFAPHGTSKGEDHRGLGLALVRELLNESGAYILCRSQPGAGTSFQILVPTHDCS